jgi:hypothetical protein
MEYTSADHGIVRVSISLEEAKDVTAAHEGRQTSPSTPDYRSV